MKRFIATEIWSKVWFRKLTPTQKAFWFYLFTTCDCAGVWDEDFGLASFAIGGDVTEQDMSVYGDRVEKLPDGKWRLVTFIQYQYTKLKSTSTVLTGVNKRLAQHGLPLVKGYDKGMDTL